MSKLIRQTHHGFFRTYALDLPIAVVVGFFWFIFRILPVEWGGKIGAALGGALGPLMKRRHQYAQRNLELAFPNLSSADRQALLKRIWRHWGRFFAELPHAAQLFQTASFEGLELLEKASSTGKGALICSAHFGNWEIACAQPVAGKYLNPVYRPANNPWLDKLLFQRRKGILLPKGAQGAKKMVEVLKNGGFVAILCDQKFNEGIEIPFLGIPAKTPTAVGMLALRLKLPIFMCRTERCSDGHYHIHISELIPAHTDNPTADIEETTRHISRVLESWIRETPEQWLWMHRRFDKSFYE